MKLALTLLALLFITATLLPLLRSDQWWVRIFDFPRIQIAVALALTALAYFWLARPSSVLEYLLLAAALGCLAYQGVRMWPYSPLAARQVVRSREARPEARLRLFIANVLMTNRRTDRFLQLVEQADPDVLLVVETDAWWSAQLAVLDARYPHSVKEPLDNTYGMLLFSRLPLVDPEVRYLVEDDIPSIHTLVELPSGDRIELHGLHPRPPYPKEDDDTTERDAELLVVGRAVKESTRPVVVAGDLNDVAWSHTTNLFIKTSGLLDPRRGRGMYNSFHAGIPLLRFPLDHIFHSKDFELAHLRRLPAFGSDHFPVLIELVLTPRGPAEQEEPEAAPEEREEAEEKIEKGLEGEE